MTDVMDALADVVAADRLLVGDAIGEDYTHDECLTVAARRARAPWCCPSRTEEVAAILRVADEQRHPRDRPRVGHRPVRRRAPPGATASWSCASSA